MRMAEQARARISARKEALVVILDVGEHRRGNLLQIALAVRLARILPGPSENRKEDRCEDGNDGDNDQQLN